MKNLKKSLVMVIGVMVMVSVVMVGKLFAIEDSFEPISDEVLDSKPIRALYSLPAKVWVESVGILGRPASEVWAYLAFESTGAAASIFSGTFGVKVSKDALFKVAENYVSSSPKDICKELASSMMDVGLKAYRRNYPRYKAWKKSGKMSQGERVVFMKDNYTANYLGSGKNLWADVMNYRYKKGKYSSSDAYKKSLLKEIASLNDSASTTIEVFDKLKVIIGRARSKSLADYPPYVDHLERIQAFEKSMGIESSFAGGEGNLAELDADNGTKQTRSESLTNSIDIKLVYIPAGEFMMGSRDSAEKVSENSVERGDQFDPKPSHFKREHPRHKVIISNGFYIGTTEVTNSQYQQVMDKIPSRFKEVNKPVSNVSWDDAVEFCRRLSEKEGMVYRLPTEAEWEYACRSGTTTPFHTGETINTNQANYVGVYVYAKGTSPVKRQKQKGLEEEKFRTSLLAGSFPPNAFGLYDMHGNQWELCQDWYDEGYYSASPTLDPQGPLAGKNHVVRGGAWSHAPGKCRSAYRWYFFGNGSGAVGFRVVMELGKEVKSKKDPKKSSQYLQVRDASRKEMKGISATLVKLPQAQFDVFDVEFLRLIWLKAEDNNVLIKVVKTKKLSDRELFYTAEKAAFYDWNLMILKEEGVMTWDQVRRIMDQNTKKGMKRS